MLEGVLLSILSGLAWMVVGVVSSRIAKSGKSILGFYMLASVISSVAAWLIFPKWAAMGGEIPQLGDMVFWISLGGAFNAAGLALMVWAMRIGHQGVTWGLGQSAMVIPFVLAMLIWGDPVSLNGCLGVVAVLLAILAFGAGQELRSLSPEGGVSSRSTYPWGWLIVALGMLLLFGFSQTMMGVPSRWDGWVDVANLRPPVDVTSTAVIFVLLGLLLRVKIPRKCWILAILWAAGSIAAYAIMYRALDVSTAADIGGLPFPVAIGAGLIGFSLYSRFGIKESWRVLDIIGLLTALAGLAFMAI